MSTAIRRVLPVLCAIAACAHPGRAQTLSNTSLRAQFNANGLASLTDLATSRTYSLRRDDFSITLGEQTFDTRSLPAPRREVQPNSVTFHYAAGTYQLHVIYELKADWRFLSKQVSVTSLVAKSFTVGDVTLLRETLAERPVDVFRPGSAQPDLGTLEYGAAIRFADRSSLMLVVQNPFVLATVDQDVATLRYAPNMEWRAGFGEFTSDRALIAPVRLSGRRLPAQMSPEWSPLTIGAPGLDEAEVAAFTGMVRALSLYQPKAPVNVFVGWCANDYQIDVGTPEGRAEYTRLFDQAAAVGAQYVLYAPSNSALSRREDSVDDWSWEHVLWLGLGQKIRRKEWDPRSSAMPPSVQEMIIAASQRKLGLLAYVYPVLPFSHNPDWLVASRNNPKKLAASLGSRALQDWLIEELVAFHARTGIAGYSFDHTFLTFGGTSRYAQWYGWRRVMEELRRRIPDIVIDGRQAHHLYGPWSYLAGSYPHPTFNDEQPESFTPFPDLHFDRVSADRERYTAFRYRNYEFTPSELVPGFMTHQTPRLDERGDMPMVRTADRGIVLTPFRTRDWDQLGWRYSVLSSIAVAGWNNVLNMLPARDSAEFANFSAGDRTWLRGWLEWTNRNKDLLRNTRMILGQPALGKVDGTAMFDGGRGYIFLFNPDARKLTAQVPLDASIGLSGGQRLAIREIHPFDGRWLGKPKSGFWSAGDTLSLTMDGGSALVLEVSPAAAAVETPVLFGAGGRARSTNGALALDGVTGEAGGAKRLTIVLPVGTPPTRVTVNGTESPFGLRDSVTVEVDVRFSGAPLGKLHPIVTWDSTFAGGRVSGTFVIPQRVFDQLARRRAAWPIPWTRDDYQTTWLAPERLLLWAPISVPDDRVEAQLSIDGSAFDLSKAYTSVRALRATFTGFYADVSHLQPDRPYRFDLLVSSVPRGRLLGLYFENVEPEYTPALPSAGR
jgi:hypothetical protein